MNLFDQLISQAMKNQGELAPLRVVIEKELLHNDILREMSGAGLLDSLTFIGGTCLRSCYGSNRLSEDLDFRVRQKISSQLQVLRRSADKARKSMNIKHIQNFRNAVRRDASAPEM